MKLHRGIHHSDVEARTGRLACRFAAVAVLISLVAPPVLQASYTRNDTMRSFIEQGPAKKDSTKTPVEKKNTQTVSSGDYVIVTATSKLTGEPTGTCYGVNVVKVTKDAVEFYVETSVMGEIQSDKKLKKVKFGEEGNFSGFTVKAENGDSTGTARLTFGCPGC